MDSDGAHCSSKQGMRRVQIEERRERRDIFEILHYDWQAGNRKAELERVETRED